MTKIVLFFTVLVAALPVSGLAATEFVAVQPQPPLPPLATSMMLGGLLAIVASIVLLCILHVVKDEVRWRYSNVVTCFMCAALIVTTITYLSFGWPRKKKGWDERERVKAVLVAEVRAGNTPLAVMDGEEFVVKGMTLQSERQGKSTVEIGYVQLQPKGKESTFAVNADEFVTRAKFTVEKQLPKK